MNNLFLTSRHWSLYSFRWDDHDVSHWFNVRVQPRPPAPHSPRRAPALPVCCSPTSHARAAAPRVPRPLAELGRAPAYAAPMMVGTNITRSFALSFRAAPRRLAHSDAIDASILSTVIFHATVHPTAILHAPAPHSPRETSLIDTIICIIFLDNTQA